MTATTIEFTLNGIRNLLNAVGNPQHGLRVLHVTGTNGKGSVCSYLSSILMMDRNLRIGKFNSPYLVHARDAITINNIPISEDSYSSIKTEFLKYNKGIGCSDFEIDTCIALKYFQQKKCNWCILEVGIGGLVDATNAVDGKGKVCGFTSISLDHQKYLGDDVLSIAQHKAGILTPGAAFAAVDGSNGPEVIKAIKDASELVGAELKVASVDNISGMIATDTWGAIPSNLTPLLGNYQRNNLSVALAMVDYIAKAGELDITRDQLLEGIQNTKWAARLQKVDLCYSQGKKVQVLMDGAHNANAAEQLGRFLDEEYRTAPDEPLCFLLGLSEGKDAALLFKPIVHENDTVIVTKFTETDANSWAKAASIEAVSKQLESITKNIVPVEVAWDAVELAAEKYATDKKLVICGSLYLCGEILKYHEQNSN
ncbi:HFL062Cp [Eremothecium sinecaudum]|uniref:Dihydrofolate synthetase n=1 Tax=Eremothecium sinecaudum TaxID=45286 RepID=A0A0X8HUK6_9SACH|nr:HFL062Cp [Eremothecium sinecaudum]AMD21794.1 HFL062Cp [Eremothecium sinecaudum]